MSMDTELAKLVEGLRKKLIDVSKRNRMLNFGHSDRSRSQIRIVGSSLDAVRNALVVERKALTFHAVPLPEDEPDDERTDAFKHALRLARRSDTQYLSAMRAIQAQGEDPQAENRIERELRNRVRKQLNLPPFRPTSLRTATEQARRQGITTDFNVSELSDRAAAALQTLLYPDPLATRLRAIAAQARLATQETGVATLYAVFGFLEWYEDSNSDVTLLAPLLVQPVSIRREKTRGADRWLLEAEEELTEPNLALVERLRSLGLSLPDFSPDGAAPVRSWLTDVRSAVEDQPGFAVHSYLTITHLSFARYAMYMDLDPKSWAAGRCPADHRLTRLVLRGKGDGLVSPNEVDHDVDNPVVEDLAPILIHDADASQHSAIIDALQGDDLVIQGPPGTGKSQTITNLIANALYRGKNVLFVAEKLAALEVVKSRLDSAGLGDFCLELHSSKLKSSNVIESLKARYYKRAGNSPVSILETKVRQLRETREVLRQYISVLAEPVGGRKMTVQDAIWRKRREADRLGPAARRADALVMSDGHGETDLERYGRALVAYDSAYCAHAEAVGTIDDNSWRFVRKDISNPFDQQDLVDAVTELEHHLVELRYDLGQLNIDKAIRPGNTLEAVLAWCDGIASLPKPAEGIWWELLPVLREPAAYTACEHLLIDIRSIHELDTQIANLCTEPVQTTSDALRTLATRAYSLNLSHMTPDQLARKVTAAKDDLVGWESLASGQTSFAARLPLPEDATVEQVRYAAHAVRLAAGAPALRSSALCSAPAEALARAADDADRLKEEMAGLQRNIDLHRLEDADLERAISALGRAGWFTHWRSDYQGAIRWFQRVRKEVSPLRPAAILCLLQRAKAWQQNCLEFENDQGLKRQLGSAFRGIATDFALLGAANRWGRQVEDFLPNTDPVAGKLNSWLLEAPTDQIDAAGRLAGVADRLLETSAGVDRRKRVRDTLSSLLQRARNEARLLGDARSVAAPRTVAFEKFQLLAKLREDRDLTARSIENFTFRREFEDRFRGQATDANALAVTLALVGHLSSGAFGQDTLDLLCRPDYRTQHAHLSKHRTHIASLAKRCGEAIGRVSDLADAAWGDVLTTAKPHKATFDQLSAVATAAASTETALRLLAEVRSRRQVLEEMELGALADFAAEHHLTGDKLNSLVDYVDCHANLKAAYDRRPELKRFRGIDLDEARARFRRLDSEVRDLQRKIVAQKLTPVQLPAGHGIGPKRTWTESALLRNEFGKDRRHIAVRDLLHRTAESSRALKPCWLMSPLAVAQFVERNTPEFDLLIIDEASQMRPEDALGSLIRAKRAIVVGDPKQLPPTDFFDRNDSVDDEDDEEETVDAKSILDLCLGNFTQPRQLTWHYRSRHPSLIAYSNREFYGNKLMTFPAAEIEGERLGIELTEIDGIYVDRRNPKEAQAVVDAAVNWMRRAPDHSLAIVTVNQTQRELIEDELERRAADDSVIDEYRDRWERRLEPFIVKNLENIQGDERDVVLISLVYGKNDKGNVFQRFGPINSEVGHRRLNVLFTRAKKKVVVFASLRPEQIVMGPETKRGVKVLRGYLEFARTRSLKALPSGREQAESPFEEWVEARLSAAGYEADFQVGEAGYRIDLGVRHPDRQGSYILGVECDGASYHRTRSTRDRDRLRQEVLEGLGWTIHRIWSVDWLADPDRQTKRLLERLEELRRQDRGRARAPAPVEARQTTAPSDPSPTAAEDESDIGADADRKVRPASREETRTRLIRLREHTVNTAFPDVGPERGILRKRMIDAFLEARLDDPGDFHAKIPRRLREETDGRHMRFLPEIADIVAEMAAD